MDLDKIRSFAKEKLSKNDLIHGWDHTRRVCELAKKLGRHENANTKVLEIAALLHDIGVHENREEHEHISAEMAREILDDYERSGKVVDVIMSHRFKRVSDPESIEAKILQDADMLDAIGAIGIVRTIYFSGYNEKNIYNPSKDRPKKESNEGDSMVDHFNNKLLRIKEELNTSSAKKIAESRHEFMENFLEQFFEEWEVENIR